MMNQPPDDIEVLDNARDHRFEAHVGEHVAFLTYWRAGASISFNHTEVPEALRGQGMGDRLARAALEHARQQGLKVVPICPFVKAYIKKHPDYEALVTGG